MSCIKKNSSTVSERDNFPFSFSSRNGEYNKSATHFKINIRCINLARLRAVTYEMQNFNISNINNHPKHKTFISGKHECPIKVYQQRVR